MTAQHTPGPLAVEFDPMQDGDHATLVIIPGRAGQPGVWVANCFHNWRDAVKGERRISWKEAEANALLFAAAHDLLAALELIWETYGFDPSIDSSVWQTVIAAIAKAKGQS